MRIFPAFVACVALLGGASAQDLPFDSTVGTSLEWKDGSWDEGPVKRVLAGDFTGDLYRDLVLVDGGQIVLAFGPAVFTARSPLGDDGVVDACAIPGKAPSGFDGLVVSDGSGWRAVWIDYTALETESSSVQVEAHTNSDWARARSLQAIVPSSGAPIVFGLDDIGTRVLRITDPFGTPTAAQFLALNSGVVGQALAVVDWNGSGAPELAVLDDEGLAIYDIASSSSPIASFTLATSSAPLQGGMLVAFRQAGQTAQRLAAVIDPAAAAPVLKVFDSVEVETILLKIGTLPVDEPYALAAGKLDDDESDELVVAHRDPDVDGPVIYTNLCTGLGSSCVTFDCGSAEVAELGLAWTDPSGQSAVPVLDDLTCDGDLDLAWFQEHVLVGSQVQRVLRLAEGTRLDHTARYVGVDAEASIVLYDGELDTRALSVRFVAPASPPTFAANKILVEEWYEGGSLPMSLHPVGVQRIKLNYPTTQLQWQTRAGLYLWPEDVPKTGVVHLTIRAARTDPTGKIVEAGPASTHSVGLGEDALIHLGTFLEGTEGPVACGSIDFDLSEYTVVPPATGWPDYPDGTFGDPDNGSEGGGGGQPPRPPPSDDDEDPPITPTNP
jgi:hypothetical protein